MNKIKDIKFPIFLPDATRAVTKSIDSCDLNAANVKGAVVNTYHLMSTPGTQVLEKLGGIKNFMNYNGLIVSDSGGWQVFSLIKRNNFPGKITNEGVIFKIGGGKDTLFTPEQSIRVQFSIGSDIIICLDDFAAGSVSRKQNEIVVDRTIHWAQRCKVEYEKMLKKKGFTDSNRPLLFSVIQGGFDKELRKKCADALIEIGFDGYGLGGYVINEDTGKMNMEISQYIYDLIPDGAYSFALGVGKPEDIVNLHKMGWQIFDCTIPTRDARHKRLFAAKSENPADYEYIYINKVKYAEDFSSLDPFCDCHTCQNFSKAYLHHLVKINDTTAFRLCTIHNLRFYTRLVESLRG